MTFQDFYISILVFFFLHKDDLNIRTKSAAYKNAHLLHLETLDMGYDIDASIQQTYCPKKPYVYFTGIHIIFTDKKGG